jgi:hypothetical protein
VAFKIPYEYDYTNKLCRTQAEVNINHINTSVLGVGQEWLDIGSIRGLNLAAVRPTAVQLLTAVSE